jgi:sRNA-binding carbon storage regulator CsrA
MAQGVNFVIRLPSAGDDRPRPFAGPIDDRASSRIDTGARLAFAQQQDFTEVEMLVISRRPGERLQIEDVVLTVVRVSRGVAEVSFRKRRSAPVVLTLQKDEFIDGCYNVRLGLVAADRDKAQLGFEVPEDVKVARL